MYLLSLITFPQANVLSCRLSVHLLRRRWSTEIPIVRASFGAILASRSSARVKPRPNRNFILYLVTCPWKQNPAADPQGPRSKAKPQHHKADCNLRQGARHLKGTYKGDLFTYCVTFSTYLLSNLNLFGLKTVFSELLHAKPCRIIQTFHQKVNF